MNMNYRFLRKELLKGNTYEKQIAKEMENRGINEIGISEILGIMVHLGLFGSKPAYRTLAMLTDNKITEHMWSLLYRTATQIKYNEDSGVLEVFDRIRYIDDMRVRYEHILSKCNESIKMILSSLIDNKAKDVINTLGVSQSIINKTEDILIYTLANNEKLKNYLLGADSMPSDDYIMYNEDMSIITLHALIINKVITNNDILVRLSGARTECAMESDLFCHVRRGIHIKQAMDELKRLGYLSRVDLWIDKGIEFVTDKSSANTDLVNNINLILNNYIGYAIKNIHMEINDNEIRYRIDVTKL